MIRHGTARKPVDGTTLASSLEHTLTTSISNLCTLYLRLLLCLPDPSLHQDDRLPEQLLCPAYHVLGDIALLVGRADDTLDGEELLRKSINASLAPATDVN